MPKTTKRDEAAERLYKLIHEKFEPWLTDSDPTMRDFAAAVIEQTDRAQKNGELIGYLRTASEIIRTKRY